MAAVVEVGEPERIGLAEFLGQQPWRPTEAKLMQMLLARALLGDPRQDTWQRQLMVYGSGATALVQAVVTSVGAKQLLSWTEWKSSSPSTAALCVQTSLPTNDAEELVAFIGGEVHVHHGRPGAPISTGIYTGGTGGEVADNKAPARLCNCHHHGLGVLYAMPEEITTSGLQRRLSFVEVKDDPLRRPVLFAAADVLAWITTGYKMYLHVVMTGLAKCDFNDVLLYAAFGTLPPLLSEAVLPESPESSESTC